MIGLDTNILLRLWLNDDPTQNHRIMFEAGSCGFADCLIVARHARLRCDFTATFDRRMRKLPGVRVI